MRRHSTAARHAVDQVFEEVLGQISGHGFDGGLDQKLLSLEGKGRNKRMSTGSYPGTPEHSAPSINKGHPEHSAGFMIATDGVGRPVRGEPGGNRPASLSGCSRGAPGSSTSRALSGGSGADLERVSGLSLAARRRFSGSSQADLGQLSGGYRAALGRISSESGADLGLLSGSSLAHLWRISGDLWRISAGVSGGSLADPWLISDGSLGDLWGTSRQRL
jgi:hypothetical protein